jgi:hypothetical protein
LIPDEVVYHKPPVIDPARVAVLDPPVWAVESLRFVDLLDRPEIDEDQVLVGREAVVDRSADLRSGVVGMEYSKAGMED